MEGGGGSRKKGLKCGRMWMLKGEGKLNVWTSTRTKINYKKRKMFKILIFINTSIPNSWQVLKKEFSYLQFCCPHLPEHLLFLTTSFKNQSQCERYIYFLTLIFNYLTWHSVFKAMNNNYL